MGIADSFKNFFESFDANNLEDTIVDYIVNQIDEGKVLSEIMDSPFVKNRINDAQRDQILNNPEIAQATLDEVKEVFNSLRAGK